MIPKLNQSGVLPPFVSAQDPTDPTGMAPYRASILEFVERYSTTPERIAILKGLLEYRKELRGLGITDGFQWIDGSFVENVELNRGRPPADIDLVTFAARPVEDITEWERMIYANTELFIPPESKDKYYCDAYFVDLSLSPIHIVSNTSYWFGLFSHQRESYLWKGMVELPLLCSDDKALALLEEVSNA